MSRAYDMIMGQQSAAEAARIVKDAYTDATAAAEQRQKSTMAADKTAETEKVSKVNAAGDATAEADRMSKVDAAGDEAAQTEKEKKINAAGDEVAQADQARKKDGIISDAGVGASGTYNGSGNGDGNGDGNGELSGADAISGANGSGNNGNGGSGDGSVAKADGQKYESYEDIFRKLNPQPRTLSDADKRKIEKKRKRETLLTAIGEGISALSNVFFASKYAPSMYKHNGMTQEAQDKWLKWGADYRRRQKEWGEGLARAKAMDAAQDKENRDWRLRLAKADYEQRIALAKEARDAAMHEVNLALELHKIDAAKAEADRKRIQAAYEQQAQEAALALSGEKVKTEKARQYEYSTQATLNKANAAKASKTWEFEGKSYDTVEEYHAAIKSAALREGIPLWAIKEETSETIEDNGYSSKKTSKSTEKDIEEGYEALAALVEDKKRRISLGADEEGGDDLGVD